MSPSPPWPTAALCAISHAATSVARTILLSLRTEPSRADSAAVQSAPMALPLTVVQTSFTASIPIAA